MTSDHTPPRLDVERAISDASRRAADVPGIDRPPAEPTVHEQRGLVSDVAHNVVENLVTHGILFGGGMLRNRHGTS